MFKRNRTPWIVGAVLILLLGIGVVAMGGKSKSKSKKSSTPPESARVLVAPADRARTVVVPPCNTPIADTVSQAKKGQGTPGATTVELPRETGVRTVLVPHCQVGKNAVNVDGNVPSALLVVPGTERLAESEGAIQADGLVAKSQLVLPGGSSASTIVVPACVKKGAAKGRDAVLGEGEGGSNVVTAPSC